MITVALSVYDSKAEVFTPPFFSRTLSEGIRSFQDAAADPNSRMAAHRDDYALFRVGSYDDSTGVFVANDVPLRICSLNELTV